jgi:hypothetical protein
MKPPRYKLPNSVQDIQHWLYIGQVRDVDVWVNSKLRPRDRHALEGTRINSRVKYNYVTPAYKLEAEQLLQPYLTKSGQLNQLFWARVKLETL